MLSKKKNLGHEKKNKIKWLIKRLRRRFEKGNLHFIGTWYKDNYEPLIDIQAFFAETHSCSPLVFE